VGAAAFANLSLEQSSGGKHFTRDHIEDRVQPSAVDVGDAFNGHGNTETVCSQGMCRSYFFPQRGIYHFFRCEV